MLVWDFTYKLDVVPLVSFNGRVCVLVLPAVRVMLWRPLNLCQLLIHHVVIDFVEVLYLIRLKPELVPGDKSHLDVCNQHHVLTKELLIE